MKEQIEKMADGKAVYFKIRDFEAGIMNTGKRSSSYHLYLDIYDCNKKELEYHFLKDVFYGKWARCESVIRRWRKTMEKHKLISI